MSDSYTDTSIVERLREVQKLGGDTFSSYEVIGMIGRAADEVERLTEELQDCQSRTITMRGELRAEIERLRAALQEIAEDRPRSHPIDIARRALEGK